MTQENETGAEQRYFSALAAGRFEIQYCSDCGRHVFHPRQWCPQCGSKALTWVQPKGTGTVYSTTTVRLNPGTPYNVALIDLDEGVRMMSRVDVIAPEDVRIGMRVSAEIVEQNKKPIVVFKAVGESK